MPADENCDAAGAAAMVDVAAGSHDGQAACCSFLPFRFWGSRGRPVISPERRRRWRRFRLRLSWFSWPWFRKSGKEDRQKKKKRKNGKKKKKSGRRRLLLLLLTSLQGKKALASVSSGSNLLPKVSSSFGDAKKQSRGEPRQTADDAAAAPTSSANETASARPAASSGRPCPRPAGGAVWRAPSRRRSLQPDRGAGLWTMATTLGVVVLFGRVTAVTFLCSCLYGARFIVAQAGGAAKATNGGVVGGGSGRFGDLVAGRVVVEDLCTEEHKKKVVMEGLLDRTAGTRPSSRSLL